MTQSLNSKVEMVVDATAFIGLAQYGNIMLGDKAFEFYHKQDARKYIQIAWDQIDFVKATVLFKGRWIPRYTIITERNGEFTFASKTPKKVLSVIRDHIEDNKMFKSKNFFKR